MRQQKRLLSSAALVVSLTLVAAACGSDDKKSTDTTAAAVTTAAGTETTAAGGASTGGQITLDQRCEENKGLKVPDGFKVSLVTDLGKIDDRTFNQFAYDGMQAAAKCFGFETSYIETASEADYEKNITTAVSGKPDMVITVGYLLATDTLAAATANADVKWIGIDQFQDPYPDNYVGVLFREDQGGFLAGTLAGLLTTSNVVGVVGGLETVPPVVRFVNAFEAGAKAINPDVKVLKVYNESFTDPTTGASNADQFIGEGADVIFGAGGKTGSGAVSEATSKGKWGIGVDQDEYFTTFNSGAAPGSEFLATSAVKRVDLGVFDNIVAALNGEFKGGAFALTAENDGITYAPFHDAVIPADVATKLEEVRKGLADGSIDTGVDPITGLPN